MIRWGALFLLLAALAPYARSESYARVCATTVDAESNETPLAGTSAPGVGEKLVVHVDASTQCVALILPLVEKGSRLANGWRPQVVGLPEWDERKLPAPPRHCLANLRNDSERSLATGRINYGTFSNTIDL
jgi:hypothetical protein